MPWTLLFSYSRFVINWTDLFVCALWLLIHVIEQYILRTYTQWSQHLIDLLGIENQFEFICRWIVQYKAIDQIVCDLKFTKFWYVANYWNRQIPLYVCFLGLFTCASLPPFILLIFFYLAPSFPSLPIFLAPFVLTDSFSFPPLPFLPDLS